MACRQKFYQGIRNNANIVKKASEAIGHLDSMAGKGEGETARKACLDIIELQKEILNTPQPVKTDDKSIESQVPLSDEAAGRILAVLAEEK
jgi:hypothetical protein